MSHHVLNNVTVVLVVAAITVPVANGANSYDGYKSSYPQLHQLTSNGVNRYDGLKSSYPQLHQLTSSPAVRAPLVRIPVRGFDWRDASVGAGAAAGAIFLVAAGALVFGRRRTRLAL